MPATVATRPFTKAEELELKRIRDAVPKAFGQTMVTLASSFLLWAASLIALIAIWLIVAAIAKTILGTSFGWRSPYRFNIVTWIAIACAVYSVIYHWRWINGLKKPTPAIQADLMSGVAAEEHYIFSEAMRLQEQEHGGLFYFLKSTTGQAYVVFDHESQELGMQDLSPLDSSFAPCTNLHIVRSPASRFVLSSKFSGPELPLSAPEELLAEPSAWPEQDEYCTVPWAHITSHFGKRKQRSDA
jgi:hypothetical protein